MANFCHQCAQPVTSSMRACPQCGAALVPLGGAPAARAAAPYEPLTQPRPPIYRAPSYAPPALPRGESVPPYVAGAGVSYRKAPFGARFLAYLIDSLVGILFMIPGGVLLGVGAATDSEAFGVVGGITFLIGFCYALWYAFTRDGAPGGAGIGKRRMRLMVIHLPTNLPATRGQSAMRTLILTLLNAVPFVGWLIEPIVALAAEAGRRLGDRAADTQVISVEDYVNG
jgi:uncharacterized RDD family membrane protein YckC